jgi:hypothetical protein
VVIVVPRYTPAWDDDAMAEAAEHPGPAEDPAPEASTTRRTRMKPLAEGHLPVTEVTFDRAGAASPFGDDQVFPLPVERLLYTHSTTL